MTMGKQVITINRMFGSNGRVIGKALAEELGISFYDKELIDMASREQQIPFDTLAKVDEKKANQWRFPIDHEIQIDQDMHFLPMNDVLFGLQKQIILDLAQKEDCIIVGRCANNILKDNAFRIFIYSPFEERLKNVMDRTGREEKSAIKLIKRMDKERKAYYEYFTEHKWTDMTQYHLCIDSSRFDIPRIVEMIRISLSK